MGTSPDDLRTRSDITRENLSRDVDALADKVSPSAIVGRRKESMQNRFSRMRDAVMGTAQSVGSKVSDTSQSAMHGVASAGSSAGESVQQTPDVVKRTTQGSPLAAGLVALGAGAIISALIPSSKPEQQAATRVKESAAPAMSQAKEKVRDAASEMKDELQPAAQEAASHIKESASGAANETAQQAKQATADVAEHARDAATSTGKEAQERAQQARTGQA